METDFAGVCHGWEKFYWTPWRAYLMPWRDAWRVVGQLLIAVAVCASAQVGASGVFAEKSWNHGSADCATNQDPAIEVPPSSTRTRHQRHEQ